MRAHPTLARRLHLPPPWTALLALAVGAAIVAWRISSRQPGGGPAFLLRTALAPGAVAIVAVYGFAWLGWALDID